MITDELLAEYYDLQKKKKWIDEELEKFKKAFHDYFDEEVGKNEKGELIFDRYKLQRQVRVIQKYREEETVRRLEELNLHDLIKTIKKPDQEKISSALHLDLLKKQDLEDCVTVQHSPAIVVRKLE